MKNLFTFLYKLAFLFIGTTAIATGTATILLLIISYSLDLPLYENIYIIIGVNALFIAFFSYVSYWYINNNQVNI